MSLVTVYLFITAAIGYGIFRLIMWRLRRRHMYELASKLDGPPMMPFIGSAHLFIGNGEDILKRIVELNTVYLPPFRVWLGPQLYIFITDPEHIKALCFSPKNLGKADILGNAFRPWLGTGLFTAPVEQWKVHRKLIQPTFNYKILESFVTVFAEQAKILTEQMERNLDGPEFVLANLLSMCTLDMICETAMGVKMETQTRSNHDYVNAVHGVATIMGKRCYNFHLHPDFIFYRTQLGKEQQKHVDYINGFTNKIIQMRKNMHIRRGSQPNVFDHEDDSTRQREAFLDLLIKQSASGADFSDEYLRAEINTMVFAGYDTVAGTMAHLLLLLASHPDIQEKVYQELYEIYGDCDIEDRPVTAKDLTSMKYLERVIKETTRLFPGAPFLFRKLTEDLKLAGGITLPNGSFAIMGAFILHRTEKYWPDPFKFNPDRFLPEENAKRHPYSFMTFSHGPRNCIGLNYAMMVMKTMAATILRRYILKKDNIVKIKDIRLQIDLMLRPVEPVAIRIERRFKHHAATI